jgi:hypothetical protein
MDNTGSCKVRTRRHCSYDNERNTSHIYFHRSSSLKDRSFSANQVPDGHIQQEAHFRHDSQLDFGRQRTLDFVILLALLLEFPLKCNARLNATRSENNKNLIFK